MKPMKKKLINCIPGKCVFPETSCETEVIMIIWEHRNTVEQVTPIHEDLLKLSYLNDCSPRRKKNNFFEKWRFCKYGFQSGTNFRAICRRFRYKATITLFAVFFNRWPIRINRYKQKTISPAFTTPMEVSIEAHVFEMRKLCIQG